MSYFFDKHKVALSIFSLGVLCWFRAFFLRGIWWDDWAWLWSYFSSDSFSEFILPFKSLRHECDSYVLFSFFKLLDIIPSMAINLWSMLKVGIFILNSIMLYLIAKSVLHRKSLLPVSIAIIYLTSPIVHNLCLVELSRRIYLFLFLLSIFCSIKSINNNKFNIFYYLSALFLAFLSMLSLESFIFFDVARPVIIFYLLWKRPGSQFAKTLKITVLYWFPFILAGVFILIDRIGLFVPRSGVYAGAYNIESLPPLKYVIYLLVEYLRSLLFILVSYIRSFVGRKAVVITADPLITLQAVIVTILATMVIFRNRNLPEKEHENVGLFIEAKIIVIFGILLILAGLFPYIMTRGGYNFGLLSRHGLLVSVGISVFMPALFLMLFYKGLIKKFFLYFLFSSVIFLGIFQCNIAVKFYGKDWEQQRSFWREFIRRVPDIKDKTYLLVDMPRDAALYFGGWRGGYEFAGPLNLFYAKSRNKKEINRFYADSMGLEHNTNVQKECPYWTIADKEEVRFESFKGDQIYYPKNLIIASYYDGFLLLNDEICQSSRNCTNDMRRLLTRIAAGQILYKTKISKFPYRWIIDLKTDN